MAAELELRYTGGAANADPDASLGGASSSIVMATGPLNNLFDNVTPGEASTGDTEYRALSLHNKGDAAAESVELYISTESASPDSVIAIGPDSGVQSIVDESTAPSAPAISFSHPLVGSKMSIPDIPTGSAQRLWFRRTISPAAGNYANDLFQLKVEYA